MADLKTDQHRWLGRLEGEWTWEMEAQAAEPGQPPVTDSGTESVRSLEGVWMMMESRGGMPEGGSATSVMTLGYDPGRQRFVGTFVGSMMTNLWIYEGRLDAAGRVLTLDTEGPSYTEEGKTAKYRDTLEFLSDDHRVQTSRFQAGDGQWRQFMTTHYRRAR
ncbi:MAG TPA: DUF1579 domain-containing protein [Longimicrobium sp.]|jgi:hypothetical protein|uniref:DUF1579 domain-containing protein n=1 Tax=Longimicrobium sp. TaxID=2029185 RepID=UPI002EDB58FD